ncbi:MAG TPA: methyltransferase domain-containing protein [Nitrososphaeraceae archaeon]
MKNILQPKSKEESDTINSFNYQWTHLSDSKYLLTDESWRENVDKYILDELSITKEDIANKTVIDVGCGGGRWSYGFAKLGCKVTSVDISEGPCKLTQKNVPQTEVIMSDLFKLQDVLGDRKFDIVWCWGVIHHTDNPRMALETLTNLMHKNSIIHLYVYSFNRGKKVKELRKFLRLFSLKNREQIIRFLSIIGILHGSVHELYDALSTQINHEINELTLKQWFAENDLSYHRYTPQWAKASKDLFVTGSPISEKK